MRWIRVWIYDFDKLVLPDICPNCLCSPADFWVPIVRCSGEITVRSHWPYCGRCLRQLRRYGRWKKWFAIAPASILAFFALLFAMQTDNRGVNPSAMWLLFAAVLVATTGFFAVALIQWWSRIPDSCLSNFPTVKIIRGGKVFLSPRTFAILDFAHPVYVERLLAINEAATLSVDRGFLQKALAEYERRLS